MKNSKTFVCLVPVLLFMILTGCTTTLSSISENPQKFAGKTVSVKGTVSSIVKVPFTETSVMILEDEGLQAAVFSTNEYDRDEEVLLKVEVVSFPKDDFTGKSADTALQVADFLEKNNISTADQADRFAGSVLKIANGLGSKLGQLFFLLEITAP